MDKILNWPMWAIISIGVASGFIFGAFTSLSKWVFSELRSWLMKWPALIAAMKNRSINLSRGISSWLKRKVRFVGLLIIGPLLILVSIGPNVRSLIGISAVVGFFLYASLLDERLLNSMIKISRRIIDRPIVSLARDSGEHFGIYLMSLGLLILAISFVLILVHAENILNLISFGLALLFGGVGFVAVYMGAQSDKRITAMAELEYNEKMAILSANVTQIRTNPFHTDTRGISYYIRSVSKLVRWIEPEEVNRLATLLTELKGAVGEFQASTKPETWEESGYPSLMAELDCALAALRRS